MFRFLLHGWRSWKSAKGVALLAIGALALGIGSATAIYSVIQAVMLNPLGFAGHDRFIAFSNGFVEHPGWRSSISYLNAMDFAARARTLDAFGCMSTGSFNLSYNHQAIRVTGTQVSPALVNALGVNPSLGRWFQGEKQEQQGLYSTVLSTRLWQRLGGGAEMVGKPLTMNGRQYTVAGVAPPWFRLPVDDADNDVWVPVNPNKEERVNRRYNDLDCVAKMKPGVTPTQAEEDLLRITHELAREYPQDYFANRAIVHRLLDDALTDIRPTLLLLLGAAAALLLIACANVAGLLLARSVARARETAIRVALGAGRGQLALQYFGEGLPVSLMGAACGGLLSYALVRVVLSIAAAMIPRADEIAVDWRVLAFALGLSVCCGVLFSLAPLAQAHRTQPNEALSDGVRASASARSRGLLRIFVVSEIALAFGLLAMGGLLVNHLGNLRRLNPGFDPDHLLTMHVFAADAKYPTDETKRDYETKLVHAIQSLPGVESAGFIQLLPLKGWGTNAVAVVEGRPFVEANKAEAIEVRNISPDYFRAMSIPRIAGRFFTARDTLRKSPDAMALIINQTLGRLYWPDSDPLGSYVHIPGFPGMEEARFQIVGVAGDVRNAGLGQAVRPELYISYLEYPYNRMTWAVRSRLDPGTLTRELRAAVLSVDPDQPLFNVQTMREVIDVSISRERLQSFMVSFFATAALVLAMLGVYGVVSYAVRQRTTEIGTRMAIGATTPDLMRLVIGDGLKMAAMGVGIGLVVVLIMARVISHSAMGVQVNGIQPFLISSGLVAGLTALACFFPAWRATLVSPTIAIRNEPGAIWQRTRWGLPRIAEQAGGLASRPDERAAASESDLLAEIAEVSRGAASFPEAIHSALDCLRNRIGAESTALFVQREAGQPYRCHGVAPGACVDNWSLPPDAAILSRLRHYPGALPIDRGELDAAERWAAENAPRHLCEIALLREIGAALAVRVAVKKEISGVLFVGRPATRAVYNALDKRLLRGVSAQFAMTIENSRLTDRIVEQERLRRELLLAAEVQKRLFPDRSPETANLQFAGVCIPARGVGGDYYDFLDLGDRNIGIALADVAGKGIAAALIMSVVQASLRSLAGNGGASLAEIAVKMNRLLHRSTGSNSYATFFYAQVDDRSRELRYVNAGHNPPYLLRNRETHSPVPLAASNAPMEELSVGGTIIGMFAQSSYEEGIAHLQPGDILIAFTDGVPEALNPRDEEYGEERLKEVLRGVAHLAVNEMASRILQDLKDWIADAAQYDDLTFILMKVN